jgi:anti-sigma factor RsiW
MFGLTCRDVSEQASEYLDGEMSWGRRTLFRFHLAMCGACATFVRQIELVRDTMPLTRDGVGLSESTRAAILDAFEQPGSTAPD